MISKKDLLKIAEFKGLQPRLAELDYLQDIALYNIYREFGNKIIFKGGTCLYKVFQLNRFSEDLDFNGSKGFKSKNFFQRLPYFFDLLNMKSRIRIKPFETGTNIYLDIHGPLYDGRKESAASIIFNVSVRERTVLDVPRHSYKPLYSELRPFDLFAMPEKEILAEKIRCIYGREKARDAYDLWYLLVLKQIPLDMHLVNKKLAHDNLKFEAKTFLARLQEKQPTWKIDLAGLIHGELPVFEQAVKEIQQKIIS